MATDYPDDLTAAGQRTRSAYERLRRERTSHFTQPVTRKLSLLGGLLGLLALALPLYWAYPASTTARLPTTDPAAAEPTVATLAATGGGVVLLAAAVLTGASLLRIERGPLAMRYAQAVVIAEDAASYLGFVTGGIAVVVGVALFALGLGGAGALDAYAALTGGHDPFARSAYGLTVLHVAALGFWGAVAVFAARWHLRRRLAALS